jgi:hypothetical protein
MKETDMRLVNQQRPEVRYIKTINSTKSVVLEQDVDKVRISNFTIFIIGLVTMIGMNAAVFLFSLMWPLVFFVAIPGWITGKALALHHNSGQKPTFLDRRVRTLTWEWSKIANPSYIDHWVYNEALQDLMDDQFGPDPAPMATWDATFEQLNEKIKQVEASKVVKKKVKELPNYIEKIDEYEKLLSGEINESVNRIDSATKVSGELGTAAEGS